MAEAPRLIRLRRPPVIHRVAEPFVPEVSLEVVDRAWAGLVEMNPRFFDGPLLHVLGTSRNGHGGVTIHVAESSYRYYAVQRGLGQVQAIDCGLRPLGVKGISIVAGDGPQRYLMAKRSASVAYYPNAWEFAPGGVVEPGEEPSATLLRELAEETAFAAASNPSAIALLYDPEAFSWEVIFRLEVAPRGDEGDAAHAWEHTDRACVTADAWPEPLAPVAKTMASLLPRPSSGRR
jgi:8-oxo-dGTP pyrophosphatase MutT (NUDIX family)